MATHEDEDDDSIDSNHSSSYQLGFIDDHSNELFLDPVWKNWDGGKIGGFPIWLDPFNIPDSNVLCCKICLQPMTFLLQIYCPLDIPQAFHRCLYLFCCRKSSCFKANSVLCLRNQIPQSNPWYVMHCSEDEDEDEDKDEDLVKKNLAISPALVPSSSPLDPKLIFQSCPQLCLVCGCLASKSCSACKQAPYCSPDHQKHHWKNHKPFCKHLRSKATTTTTRSTPIPSTHLDASPSRTQTLTLSDLRRESLQEREGRLGGRCHDALFPELPLVVQAEDMGGPGEEERAEIMSKVTVWEDAEAKEEADGDRSDENLKQRDYSLALGNEAPDPVYLKFLERLHRGGEDQVLRYLRWPLNTLSPPFPQPTSVTPTFPPSPPIIPIPPEVVVEVEEEEERGVNVEIDNLEKKREARAVASSPEGGDVGSSIVTSDVPPPPPLPVDLPPVPVPVPVGPLLISSLESCRDRRVPACPICGGVRDFEFQVMPQLLYYLGVDKETGLRAESVRAALAIQREGEGEGEGDGGRSAADKGVVDGGGRDIKDESDKKERDIARIARQAFANNRDEDLDWGSLDIYTCLNSCTSVDGNGYISEYVWVQQPFLPISSKDI